MFRTSERAAFGRVNCRDSPFASTDMLAFFAYSIARDRRKYNT
jgi:hypothetical protein